MSGSLDTVVTIPIIAFDAQHRIDEDTTTAVSERMLRHGISVLTVNGNTGEYYSLSAWERRQFVDLGAQFAGRAELIAGVGLDTATAKADAAYALDQGYQHIMIHLPPHPFISPEGWVSYNREIAEEFPQVNIIPYVKSSVVTNAAVRDLIEQCPNIRAVKYAIENPHDYGSLVETTSDEITWICGVAEKWAPAFWANSGLAAFTSGLANVSPKFSLDLYRALKDNDSEKITKLWRLARPFEDLRAEAFSKNNVSIVKEALHQLGLAEATVRPPISSVGSETAAAVTDFLTTLREAGYITEEE